MIDIGSGPSVVMIPGVQGRWEWMAPAVDALSKRCRAISFSLAGERGSMRNDQRSFDEFVAHVDEVLDRAGLERAAICGVSYGGLIAVRYAALRPRRTAGLILVSAPSPRWRPDARVRRYCQYPRLLGGLFFLEALGRFANEMIATYATWDERLGFVMRQAWTVVKAPMSPTRAGRRVKLADGIDFVGDCRRIMTPALVVTGDPRIAPQIVPAEETLEYLEFLPQATSVVFEHTGHLGLVTRPHHFAAVVSEFVHAHAASGSESRTGAQPTPPEDPLPARRTGALADARQ